MARADPRRSRSRCGVPVLSSVAPVGQPSEGWPEGIGLFEHAEIDSTNEEARRLALQGHRGPLWVRADRQTAGRGRRGRAWLSDPGNLFATLLDAPGSPLPRAAEVSFVAGLAVHDAACAVAPNLVHSLTLKWPNDLLLEGAKLAGILIETAPGPAGHRDTDPLLAIGIGVNLASHPDGVPYPATSFAACGAMLEPSAFLVRLAASMQARMTGWKEHGFASVRQDWLARAHGLGEPLIVRLPDDELAGEFVSLDVDGALALRTDADGALRKITAGDVFFPAHASNSR